MDPQDIAIAFYRNLGDRAGAAHAERMSKSDPANAASYLKAAEIIRGGNPYANAPKGHMYEVNINARPEQFLDWDRPLAQQGSPANEGVNSIIRLTGRERETLPTRSVYEMLGSPQEASSRLREAGIPGIKYFDAGSRDAGEGTRNYVVFDDRLIDIMKKYGLPMMTAGAGAASIADQPGAVGLGMAQPGAEEQREGFQKGGVIARAIRTARETLSPEELLMGIHNTGAGRKLEMIERLGGLPAPSIAVTKPSQGYTSFGDISLVAPVEMVTPGRKTPAFGSDVYSPRFPSVEDDQIFRGFTPSGSRRYAPVTMENVLREMKGPIRGGENFNYGPGSIRAQVTPQFGSLPEMQAAREKIIPSSEFGAQKEISNEMMERLRERFEPYFKPTDPYRRSWSAFPEVMTDYARTGRPSEFAYDYKDLPAEALTEARSFLGHLRDMPTEYFEVKPQRAVPLGEFAGAVVPGDVPGEVMDRLRRLGVSRIEEYGDDASRRDALMKFVGEQGFAEGGEVRESFQKGGRLISEALEAAGRYIRPRSPEQSAVDIAQLLRAAREKEVTDSLLEQADPRALFELYAAGRTGADMPMDYASRMKRAADQGFDKLIYRGTQSREALNRSLRTDRPDEGSKTFGTGSWASSDPDVAGTYSGLSEFSPVTMPLMVRSSELREVPWGGGLWSEGPGGQTTDRVARAAREEGAKGLTFSNITDIGPHFWNRADTQKRLPDTSDTTVIFDPSIVRSPFARFDPRLEHLLDLNRKDGGRAVDVARDVLLEDEYPSQYLPNVGRQVMQDGGVPAAGEKYEAMPGFFSRMLGLSGGSQPEADIQQYENRMRAIARQPEDIRSMTHAPSKPLRPVEIEGGLIGKRTLGEVPYDVAGPLAGTAQTAYSLKTLPFYFTPAAPLAAAADFGEAAIDTAKAAREGDYLGAGITGALGVAMPGYAYRRPIGDVVGRALSAIRSNPAPVAAGAAGAAVMTPEEAEAGKFEPIQRLLSIGMKPSEIERALQIAKERIPPRHPQVMWHGTPSGDLRGGISGLHLGTHEAARQALNARIGAPAQGDWTGLRVYGETPLAGRNTILSRDRYGLSGYNMDAPTEDYIPTKTLRYANNQEMPMTVEPVIYPFRIVGPMSNSFYSPMSDMRANAKMKEMLTKQQARRGYYYKNEGEDVGSISAVVPGGNHVEPIDLERLLRTGEYAAGGSVSDRAIELAKELGSSPREPVTS